MRIEVDLPLCQGHGQCEESAPEVFEVGDDAVVHLLDEDPPESRRPAVEEAARRCPVEALRIGPAGDGA
ncbi:ferredoxin [Streptomyces sp. NPDC050560]|uniref:ferredoxin n=1 Tax=Streptomyces sp. NPDC050560 TaxID=3365630 RepID=UPI00378C8980